jgi:hypothetical protein
MMEEFNPPELQQGNDCTLKSMCRESLETFPGMLPTKRKSAMPDCPQITEEKRVKLVFLDRFHPGTAIIKHIGSGLNFRKKRVDIPFGSIQEKSKKLLSCTSADCEDLVLNSWNLSAKKLLSG